ncbi:hypothetical protein [Limnohabitans sp. T6-5]|uniref:hypothetical protein n=1 Tax=Limnohabitans sp. T6-5 TaxID=1100724 RepID=UPI001E37E5C9|nr:hypothetical protein [Limnohabitans sp. T6-5]
MKKPNQTKAPNKSIDMNAPVLQYTVAEVVGVSQQAISAMVNSGKLPPCQTTGELIAAYCARLREQAAGRLGDTVGGLDPAHESAALKRAQREGQEIKNAVLRGEYAPITLLAEVLAAASQSVVERLDQLPAALRKTCPDLPEAARDQVMNTIASARNEWVRATCELLSARLVVDLEDEFSPPESSDVE